MTQFHVGQKVVCVNPVDDLKLGEIYTITASHKEFVGVDRSYFCGLDFYAFRFRPIVKRKTDISQFKAMLNPQKTEVTA